MTQKERIDESHGIWELAVVRLAALASVGAATELVQQAWHDERAAWARWVQISHEVTGAPEPKA